MVRALDEDTDGIIDAHIVLRVGFFNLFVIVYEANQQFSLCLEGNAQRDIVFCSSKLIDDL